MKLNRIEILFLLAYLALIFSSYVSFSVREDLLYVVDVVFWNGGILYLKVYLAIPAVYFISCLIDKKFSFRSNMQFLLICYVFLQNIISMLVGVFYVNFDIAHILLFFVNLLLFFSIGFCFLNSANKIKSSLASSIVAVSSVLVCVPHIFFLLDSLK